MSVQFGAARRAGLSCAPVAAGRVRSWLVQLLRPEGRALWLWSSVIAVIWAALVSRDMADPAHHVWGLLAMVAYGACVVAALVLPRRLVGPTVTLLGLAGAVVVPLLVLAADSDYQSEVGVVERSATLLLRTGADYLPNPQTRFDYNPYLPGMAMYGMPHELLDRHPEVGLGGRLLLIAGDARVWFAVVLAVCLLVSWRLLREDIGYRLPGRFGAVQAPLAIIGFPVIALPLCVSGVDLPLVGLTCLALACAGRGQHGVLTGLISASACVLKWTAWPLLPVAVVLVAKRRGTWHAIGCAVTGLVGIAATILPPALKDPQAAIEQVVRFPLGLARVRTPAVSPLLGHALADLGVPGRIADVVLLVVSCLAVSWWTVRRPPHTTAQAANRLALWSSAVFLLSPASRFGYFVLPAVVWLLPHLAAGDLSLRRWSQPTVPED